MTKSRLIYLAVMTVALLALLWDKTQNQDPLTAPQDIAAQVQPAIMPPILLLPEVPLPQANPIAQTSQSPAPSALAEVLNRTLPAPLRNIWPAAPAPHENKNAKKIVRNLFAASQQLRAMIGAAQEPKTPQEAPPPAPNFKLSAIMIGPQGTRSALIDNEVIFAGQYIGPYRLKHVNPRYVVLQLEDQQLLLSLD